MLQPPCAALTLIAVIGQTDAMQAACLLHAALSGFPGLRPALLGPDTLEFRCADQLTARLTHMASQSFTHAILVLDRPALARRTCSDLHISIAAPMAQASAWDGLSDLLARTDTPVFDLDETDFGGYGNNIPSRAFTYSENKGYSDLTARNLRSFPGHTEFEAVATGQICRIHLPLCGGFAVYPALCALSCGLCLGLSLNQMAPLLRTARGPAGCMEVLSIPAAYTVLLDRADDLRNLERVLTAARNFTARRLVCLLNGQSDAPMLALAEHLADRVLPYGNARADRRQAIVRGLDRAGPGDVLVLTGADGGKEEREFIRACAHNCAVRHRRQN